MLVEFGKKILIIGGIFFKLGGKRISGISSVFNWGHFFLIGGIFFKLGANVLVEYEKKF